MPWLSITAGSGAGQRHELRGERLTIGRDPANQVQIADPKSSRVHAEVTCDGGRYQVRDLDSSNGTWLGEGRISSLPLSHGSEFRIGATSFRFDSMDEGGAWSDPSRIQALDQAKTVLFTPAPAGDPQTLARTNAYLVLLHHLIHRANAAPDREALFELLDDAAAEALDGDRCAVLVPHPDAAGGWMLWPAHERRLRARFGAVPFAQTLLAAIHARKEPLLCTSEGDLAPSLSMVQAGVQSAMAAPVRLGDEVHALLYVDRLAGGQPFTRSDLEFLSAVANQMAVHLANRATVAALQQEVQRLQRPAPPPPVIGSDPGLAEARTQAERLAQVALPVLISGEAGTGKELMARYLHAHSPRATRPFQVVTCANLEDPGAEGMLFGRGRQQGVPTPGVFEIADGGTVFLDELADLPLAFQARLLRLLEAGEVQRPGEATLQRVDVRLIAASARDLDAAQASGRLRADLVHALAGKQLALPPLRQRLGDLEALADGFLDQQARSRHQPPKRLSVDARAALMRHGWPGNVRELRQVVERAAALSDDQLLHPEDLPDGIRSGVPGAPTSPIVSLTSVERAHILRVLAHCGGNKKAAAELLEIDRSTLYAKLKQYGVN